MKNTLKLSKMIESLDIFGQPISFYMNGKTKYQSFFGGIITLFMGIIIMTITIFSIINLINRSDMKSTQQTNYEINPPYLDLNQQNFMFSIGIEISNMMFNYTTVFDFKAYLVSRTQFEEAEEWNPINLRPCQGNDYEDKGDEIFSSNYQNYYCPDNFSYPLEGSQLTSRAQNIVIYVMKCSNDSDSNVTCASDKDIEEYIEQLGFFQLNLLFMNNIVDLQNHTTPFKKILDFQTWILNPYKPLVYLSYLYLKLNQILSYDDIFGIFPPNTYSDITFEKQRLDNSFIPQEDFPVYAIIILSSSNYQNFYTRTYNNLLAVLSYIGGILHILSIVAGFIVGIFNNFKYKIKILNKVYDFDMKHSPNDKNIPIHLDQNSNSSFEIKLNPPKYDHASINEQFNLMKSLRTKLPFTLFEIFCSICSCLKSKSLKLKSMLFDLANEQLSRDMDIVWLIKKMHDIDKLKNIILYPNKLKMFDFIPPRIISINEEENIRKDKKEINEPNESIASCKEEKLWDDLEKYYKYGDLYINVKKNKDDNIGQNLIRSLDPHVQKVFDCIEKAKKTEENVVELPTIRTERMMSLIIDSKEDHKKDIELIGIEMDKKKIIWDPGNNPNSLIEVNKDKDESKDKDKDKEKKKFKLKDKDNYNEREKNLNLLISSINLHESDILQEPTEDKKHDKIFGKIDQHQQSYNSSPKHINQKISFWARKNTLK